MSSTVTNPTLHRVVKDFERFLDLEGELVRDHVRGDGVGETVT